MLSEKKRVVANIGYSGYRERERERQRERENFCNYIQNADTNEICYLLMNISSNFTGKRVRNDEYGHK